MNRLNFQFYGGLHGRIQAIFFSFLSLFEYKANMTFQKKLISCELLGIILVQTTTTLPDPLEKSSISNRTQGENLPKTNIKLSWNSSSLGWEITFSWRQICIYRTNTRLYKILVPAFIRYYLTQLCLSFI